MVRPRPHWNKERVAACAWDAGAHTLSNWVDDEMNPTMMGDAGDEMSTTVKELPSLLATNA